MTVKLDVTCCRVWRAGPELLAALPAESSAARFNGTDADSGIHNHIDTRCRDWLVCTSCEWHTDWPEVFEYVIVRGHGTLHVVDEPGSEESVGFHAFDDPEYLPGSTRHRVHVERGDVIQLWPMAPHKMTVSTRSVSMLAAIGAANGKFKSKKAMESRFVRLCQKEKV